MTHGNLAYKTQKTSRLRVFSLKNLCILQNTKNLRVIFLLLPKKYRDNTKGFEF